MKTLFTVLFSLSVLMLCAQTQIYVSTKGSDQDDGSIHSPVKSMERVQQIIKTRSNSDTPGFEILFSGGTYHFRDTIEFVDSHISLRFAALGDEKVVFTTGFEIGEMDIVDVQDPELVALIRAENKERIKEIDLNRLGIERSEAWPLRFRGYAGWPELYFNNTPLQISRWPNDGFAKIDTVIERGSRPRKNEKPDKPGIFKYAEENPSTWNKQQEVYLAGYWCFKWYDEIIKVDRVIPESKEIHMAAPHHYGIGGPSGGLFYAINLLEEIDMPGEYVYDRKRNKIYLLLPEGYNSESKLEITFKQGNLFTIRDSKDISFRNITFSGHNGNIFNIYNSVRIAFNDCNFSKISRTAVNILGGENCGLNNCHLFHIGESGVVMEAGNRETLEPSAHYASNCHLHHFARHIKTNCPALHIKGVGQILTHNYIHDAPHAAIFFWGNDHLIDGNRIERVCLNTSDAGAIYTGRDWTFGGNVISNNYISDLGEAAHHHNWGIYIDDMASGVEIRGNIIANSPSGILLGGGRSNVVANNLMLNTPRASVRYDSRAMGWAKYHVEKYSGIMWERLFAMPYDKSPWKDRFPYLLELESDKHPEPRHNTITGNFVVNSEKMNLDKVVVKTGLVENNHYLKQNLDIQLENGKIRIFPTQNDLKDFEEKKYPLW